MSNEFETNGDVVESDSTQVARENNAEPQTTPNPPDFSRKEKGKSDWEKPLEPPLDEAIAQYLATPKSFREFKSFTELAERFNTSRMTCYRRSKCPHILERVEWLVQNHRLAGDLIARLHWPRIVAGQVKAAVAGDTKAAQFCKEQAWPGEMGAQRIAKVHVVWDSPPMLEVDRSAEQSHYAEADPARKDERP
jgi:hypothetical protein